MVCPENFFDPQIGTLTENVLANVLVEKKCFGRKKIPKCPIYLSLKNIRRISNRKLFFNI